MKCYYGDILDRIDEEPKWWDEYGVPRYCNFTPRDVSDIYAVQVVLFRIRCQSCHQEFDVATSWSGILSVGRPLIERLDAIHYGDPPNVGCCGAGATMNSEALEILEVWNRNRALDWRPVFGPFPYFDPDAAWEEFCRGQV